MSAVLRMGDGMPAPERLREHGSIHWDQLLTNNSDVMAKFYSEVCGWTVDKYELEDLGYYGVFKSGEEPVIPLSRTTWQHGAPMS